MPDDPEVRAALALMLYTDARRDSRIDAVGDLVTLELQDRSRWDRVEIEEANRLLEAAVERPGAGHYAVQAMIAAAHDNAGDAAATDWPEIARLYRQLAELTRSPVVELNRAVAVAMAEGPEAGLALVDTLDVGGDLAGYYLVPATRADLLRRLGRADEAALSYELALGLAPTETERRYLSRRLSELGGSHSP